MTASLDFSKSNGQKKTATEISIRYQVPILYYSSVYHTWYVFGFVVTAVGVLVMNGGLGNVHLQA